MKTDLTKENFIKLLQYCSNIFKHTSKLEKALDVTLDNAWVGETMAILSVLESISGKEWSADIWGDIFEGSKSAEEIYSNIEALPYYN